MSYKLPNEKPLLSREELALRQTYKTKEQHDRPDKMLHTEVKPKQKSQQKQKQQMKTRVCLHTVMCDDKVNTMSLAKVSVVAS